MSKIIDGVETIIIYEALTEQKQHLVEIFGAGWVEQTIDNWKSFIIGSRANEIPEFEKIADKFKGGDINK